ncbi:hypothetical protein [Alicyclobacillus acidiphilus]|uniref:hypothetical protein n=1 Tax=Alicyclobacillus acidiphilus TaxID=182455 RepID=UPI000AAFB3FE|nr:hypothetical protein [Alicyclobacillus acidiphilus]
MMCELERRTVTVDALLVQAKPHALSAEAAQAEKMIEQVIAILSPQAAMQAIGFLVESHGDTVIDFEPN